LHDSQQRHGLSVFCSGTHSVSCLAISLMTKQMRHEANPTHSSNDEVKNLWSSTCIYPYIFMVWCSIIPASLLAWKLVPTTFDRQGDKNQGTGKLNEAADRNGHVSSAINNLFLKVQYRFKHCTSCMRGHYFILLMSIVISCHDCNIYIYIYIYGQDTQWLLFK
jgi:hypothetical protein